MLIFNGNNLLGGIIVVVNLDGIKTAFLKDRLVELLRNNPILKLPI